MAEERHREERARTAAGPRATLPDALCPDLGMGRGRGLYVRTWRCLVQD